LFPNDGSVDGLAVAQNAPAIFKRTTRNGLPWAALLCSTAFAFLAFMGVSAGSGKVFGWFANMTAVAGLMTWFGIAVTYIRFYAGTKAQGLDRSKLPYSSKLQPYAAWYAAISCLFISFVRPPADYDIVYEN
jgi:amino acid transporter